MFDLINIEKFSNKDDLTQFVREMNFKDYFIAGGSVNDVYNKNQIIGDIDIFFYNQEAFESAIKNPIISSTRESKWAVTFHNKDYEIQLIKKNFGSIKDVLHNFDINKSGIALDSNGNYHFSNNYNDKLHIVHDSIRMDSFKRYIKYYNRSQKSTPRAIPEIETENVLLELIDYLTENPQNIEAYYTEHNLSSDKFIDKTLRWYMDYFGSNAKIIKEKYPELFL